MISSRERSENPKKLPLADALNRIYRYCAYQERSHQEVKAKLYSFGLSTAETEDLLTRMITEGFLNEERFAKAFTGGKFRMQKWGRNKIIHTLEGKGLTQNCIRTGLKEIDEPDYRRTLKELVEKRSSSSSEPNPYIKRDRIARYAISKGFEPDLVWEVIKALNL